MKAFEIEDLINKKLGVQLERHQARSSVALKPYLLNNYKLLDQNVNYIKTLDVEHAVVKATPTVRKIKLKTRNDLKVEPSFVSHN